VRKPDGRLKLLVYRKTTHTDQYLHFSSRHPLQHKLTVIRTLLYRGTNIVTEEEDRKQEEDHIHMALTRCGYPDWSIDTVERQMTTAKLKKVTRRPISRDSEQNRTTVVIPYVQGLSEAVTRAYRRHGIPTAMKPFQSIRSLLVQDKLRPQYICECVYQIPCKNCKKVYIGETGRPFGVRLQEH